MPTYQYLCTECGDALEVQQSFTDDALTICPNCNGRLRKVFNAVGVVFKGSGFYRNDSRSTTTSSTSATAPSSDSDSKPAAAPAKKEPAGSTGSVKKDSGSAA